MGQDGAGLEGGVPTPHDLSVPQGQEMVVPKRHELATAKGPETTVPVHQELGGPQGQEEVVPKPCVHQGLGTPITGAPELEEPNGAEMIVPKAQDLGAPQGAGPVVTSAWEQDGPERPATMVPEAPETNEHRGAETVGHREQGPSVTGARDGAGQPELDGPKPQELDVAQGEEMVSAGAWQDDGPAGPEVIGPKCAPWNGEVQPHGPSPWCPSKPNPTNRESRVLQGPESSKTLVFPKGWRPLSSNPMELVPPKAQSTPTP